MSVSILCTASILTTVEGFGLATESWITRGRLYSRTDSRKTEEIERWNNVVRATLMQPSKNVTHVLTAESYI